MATGVPALGPQVLWAGVQHHDELYKRVTAPAPGTSP
jgi:hypothetical protein